MDPARWREVCDLFDALVELPAGERERRLAGIGSTDPGLRDDVARLIDADRAADARLARVTEALPSDSASYPRADRPSITSPPDPIGMHGRMVAHFRVLDLIGVGGMGAVYRAEDTRLGRIVALKLPLPAQLLDASGRSRFLREARAVAALDHPNVCDVHEVGESGEGQLFLAMPHYGGETLKERLAREGALGEDAAAGIARQVAAGLAAAHRAGIVHRDLKPGNVMVLPDDSVRILDFGLAKQSGASLTTAGDRLGTVSYMAPEQIRGDSVDARADLWALGVMMYEMLTGSRPFAGASDLAVAHAILHDAPSSPSRGRNVSPALADLVLRLLVRDPGRRVASADAVSAELAPGSLASQRGIRRAMARRSGGIARAVRNRPGRVLAFIGVAAVALILVLIPRARSDDTGGTADPVAHDLYLRGRDYEGRGMSEADLRNAGDMYRRAIARDSGYALARARYAITQLLLIGTSPSPDELERPAAHARAALARAPDLGDAHVAMGRYWLARGEPERALDAFRTARARLRESVEVSLGIAEVHLGAGRWREAVAALEDARKLAPRDLTTVRLLGYTYSRLREYERAAAAWEVVTSLAPDDYVSLLIKGYIHIRWRGSADTLAAVLRRIPPDWDAGGMKTFAAVAAARIARAPAAALAAIDSARWLVSSDLYTWRPIYLLRAQVYDDLGDSASARAWYKRTEELVEDSLAVRPGDPRLHIAQGWAYAGLGRQREAVAAARRAMGLVPAESNVFNALPMKGAAAEVFARAGAADEALALLDTLLALPAGREASVALLGVDPTWNPIRSDPRFEAMLVRHR
ncbi:MAG TPA: serine/threonine-protein kinase [Gemmatimonadales bacterium]|nr:serine/threonine-protein kinase [Gemmatimonadales bacterium]